MDYRNVLPISHSEAEAAFTEGTSAEVCDALVRITYHDPDWRWVQRRCIQFSKHSDASVRGLAANCLGDLARIHHKLDLEEVIPVLNQLLIDPEVRGRAEDALADIEMFLRISDH
jgi:hypothetical protein